MLTSLPVINLAQAQFECTFGRGCDGLCCRNGRPPIYPEEVERIEQALKQILPHVRPGARQRIERAGFLSRRHKFGLPMLRVESGWCVFFNEGCVLHKVGAAEGDKYRYKPAACALFPLARNDNGDWYVRQHGYERDKWSLFCLCPHPETPPAAETLKEEIALAARYMAEEEQSK